jgi:hypothetical protein
VVSERLQERDGPSHLVDDLFLAAFARCRVALIQASQADRYPHGSLAQSLRLFASPLQYAVGGGEFAQLDQRVGGFQQELGALLLVGPQQRGGALKEGRGGAHVASSERAPTGRRQVPGASATDLHGGVIERAELNSD